VRSLVFDQGIVYAGGGFTSLAGTSRVCVAAVSPASGAALPWDAALQTGHTVMTVAAGGGHVFAGGTQVATGSEPTEGFSPVIGPDPLLDVPAEHGSGTRLALRVEPRPVRAVARIRFRLQHSTDVEIGVYDLAGRRVAVVDPRRHREAGEYSVPLEPAGLRPGLYLVRVSTREASAAERMIRLQ
jgi:hypothetical protein